MPFEVDSPLAAGLGFAGSYMAGQQQKQKDLQAFKQQQLDNARLASQLALEQQTGSQNATTFAQGQKKVQDQQQLAAWDAANPQPAFSDTQAMSKWAAQRATKARSLGLSDEAKDTATDYRTGQQAEEYGANAAYTSGAKTNATNAGTDLTKARTQFEQAHAQNEKGRFAHEMQMLSAREQAQVKLASMRIGAMLQAAQMRSSTSYGVAQMNNDTRRAISERAALISLHNHDEASSLQIAMQQYKGQEQAYLKNLGSYDAGKETPQGFDPTTSMPQMPPVNVNVSAPGQSGMDPQLEAMLFASLAGQHPGGNPPGPQTGSGAGGGNPNGKKPSTPTINVNAEVPAVVKRLQSGMNPQAIAQQYRSHGVSEHDIHQIMAIAHTQAGQSASSGGNPFANAIQGVQHFFQGQ